MHINRTPEAFSVPSSDGNQEDQGSIRRLVARRSCRQISAQKSESPIMLAAKIWSASSCARSVERFELSRSSKHHSITRSIDISATALSACQFFDPADNPAVGRVRAIATLLGLSIFFLMRFVTLSPMMALCLRLDDLADDVLGF
jgi:hypothetical protein